MSQAFAEAPPAHSRPLQDAAQRATANVGKALIEGRFSTFPTIDRGVGMIVDLRDWFPINAYSLQWELFAKSQGRIDLILSLERGETRHYVSGRRARRARDLREGSSRPRVRLATFHRGSRSNSHRFRRRPLDLRGLIEGDPASHLVSWIDAHPYLVKAEWLAGHGEAESEVEELCALIQAAAQRHIAAISWGDQDRYRPYYRRRVPPDPS